MTVTRKRFQDASEQYQKDKLEVAMIEKLHELQQEKLLDLDTGEITKAEYDKLVEKMNNKLAHLHMITQMT